MPPRTLAAAIAIVLGVGLASSGQARKGSKGLEPGVRTIAGPAEATAEPVATPTAASLVLWSAGSTLQVCFTVLNTGRNAIFQRVFAGGVVRNSGDVPSGETRTVCSDSAEGANVTCVGTNARPCRFWWRVDQWR